MDSGMDSGKIGMDGPGPTEAEVREFGQKWGVDAGPIDMVLTMPPPVQAAIIKGFNPPAETENVNGKLVKFAIGALRTAKERVASNIGEGGVGVGDGTGC